MVREDFETLTLKYMDSLYYFALTLTRDKEYAEDLVQETYLRAHRFYHQYQNGTNYKAWLFTLMRNIFINDYHKRAKEISLSDLDTEDEKEVSYEPLNGALFSFDTTLGKGIFAADIENALNELPQRLKTVVILKDVVGLDYKEISRVLDCPVGTVMSRLWRSRNFLKKRLKDYSQGRLSQSLARKQHEDRVS